ncbi:MAG: hypothetical protein AB8H79_19440 [Myxococcota bacterium]
MDIKSQFDDLTHFLDGQRSHWLSRARRRAWRVQTQGQEASWTARVQGMQQLDRLTEPLTGKPIIGRIAGIVDHQLARLQQTGIDGYDELTAKAIVAAVKEIDSPLQLRRISAHETANKDRKTVASAVQRRLTALEPTIVAAPERNADEQVAPAA